MCPRCGVCKQSETGVAAHMFKVHGVRGKYFNASRWAPDAVCRACGMSFATRAALLDHLVRGSGCLAQLQVEFPPLSDELANRLATADQHRKRALGTKGFSHRAVDRPAYRLSPADVAALPWEENEQ